MISWEIDKTLIGIGIILQKWEVIILLPFIAIRIGKK